MKREFCKLLVSIKRLITLASCSERVGVSSGLVLKKFSLSLFVKDAMAAHKAPDYVLVVERILLATTAAHIVYFGSAELVVDVVGVAARHLVVSVSRDVHLI